MATKEELRDGLSLFGRKRVPPPTATKAELTQLAADEGCLLDIEERVFLCRSLKIEFLMDLTNLELVHLAREAGVDFNKWV